MAEVAVSQAGGPARVARNHLSQPIPSSARSAEKGADSAPSLQEANPPLAAFQRSRALPRQDRRCHFYPRATCGSRRSRHSRSLGRRSVARGAQQSCGHAGGASFAVLHAGEGARQGHNYGGGRLERARAHSARDVAALADLGPRVGDGPAQKLHDGYGRTGFTSAIPKAHGSAVRTKTRTGCCGNTCRRRRICPATHSRTWTRSLCASINGHEKHWDLKLRRIDCKPVLHRPLETTPVLDSYLWLLPTILIVSSLLPTTPFQSWSRS